MLARIRLKPLIIGSALTITLCTIFQGGAAVWSSNELGRQLHVATDNSLKSVALLSEMRGDMFRIQSQLAQLILAETPEGAKAIEAKIEENITEVDGNFDSYEHLVSDEAEAKLFADLRDKWARWTMSIDAVRRDALNQQEQDARNGFAMKQGPASQELDAALNKELQYNEVLAEKAADEGDRASTLSLESNILFTAISVLASLAILIIFVRRVTSPMTRLTETMQHMARGAFDIDVPCTEKKDELGDMANALGDIRTGIADWSRGEAEKREKVQRQVVTALGEGLTAMKDGNLVYRIDTPFPSAYEGLRADFNKALEELAGVIRAVTETTQSVRSGSTEISSATDDLSQRTERQAASLEETAAAVDQLTATVGETAQAAASASAAANSAQKDAVDSSRIVDEAVTAMESIARSSQQMEAIVAMIDGVAFQTNLLALNAGIEAARAGDAGNGFAVVANEVRALAQRSAAAAQEIKGLITASGEQVNAGVELVNTAGTTLARIRENATEVSSLVARIAQSAQEQASSIRQVNEVVRDLDTITQQNAALVEESTAASRQLAGQAVGLATMVDRFRVGGSAARSAPAGRTAAAPRSAPRATRAASAPTVASTGNAALKLDTVSDAGADWDEF